MKKIVLVLCFVFAAIMLSAQSKVSFSLSIDANAPLGAFAKSEYRLAAGANQYFQEGTFSVGPGVTLGLEVPITSDFIFRPNVSLAYFKGSHFVGGFDKPSMYLSEVRAGGDLLVFLGQGLYLIGSIGANYETLKVDRRTFDENFDAKRVTAGVGVGYDLGSSLSIEGMFLKSVSGVPPCTDEFPTLQYVKMSLCVRF